MIQAGLNFRAKTNADECSRKDEVSSSACYDTPMTKCNPLVVIAFLLMLTRWFSSICKAYKTYNGNRHKEDILPQLKCLQNKKADQPTRDLNGPSPKIKTNNMAPVPKTWTSRTYDKRSGLPLAIWSRLTSTWKTTEKGLIIYLTTRIRIMELWVMGHWEHVRSKKSIDNKNRINTKWKYMKRHISNRPTEVQKLQMIVKLERKCRMKRENRKRILHIEYKVNMKWNNNHIDTTKSKLKRTSDTQKTFLKILIEKLPPPKEIL